MGNGKSFMTPLLRSFITSIWKLKSRHGILHLSLGTNIKRWKQQTTPNNNQNKILPTALNQHQNRFLKRMIKTFNKTFNKVINKAIKIKMSTKQHQNSNQICNQIYIQIYKACKTFKIQFHL